MSWHRSHTLKGKCPWALKHLESVKTDAVILFSVALQSYAHKIPQRGCISDLLRCPLARIICLANVSSDNRITCSIVSLPVHGNNDFIKLAFNSVSTSSQLRGGYS